jgi:hypothetical protein
MEQVKNRVYNACLNEIESAKYYIGFYKHQELNKDKKISAEAKLKRMQLETALKSNQDMLKKLDEYNATL